MALSLARVILVVAGLLMGYWAASEAGISTTIGVAVGGLIAAIALLIELLVSRRPSKSILWIGIGVVGGLVIGGFLNVLAGSFPSLAPVRIQITVAGTIAGCYLGVMFALRGSRVFLAKNQQTSRSSVRGGDAAPKVLDTSAVIDGRIKDISETGFVEGRLVVPRFVLNELQAIADSPDPLRRARGRRGLEMLTQMSENGSPEMVIDETDFPEVPDVDAKLIKLAKLVGGYIVTTDLNLNRVAQVEGIGVLNVNDLANAIKTIVLPGEEMTIRVTKRGKEEAQGVGYLDDGTMVVVERAADLVGRKIRVVVTSVLQTTAGRLVFGKIRHNHT